MPYGRKIVLHCPRGYRPTLDALVQQLVNDGVIFVGIVGQDCSRVEDIVDELIVGDGSIGDRGVLTSSHEGQSLEEAIQFAQSLTGEYSGEVQVVEL